MKIYNNQSPVSCANRNSFPYEVGDRVFYQSPYSDYSIRRANVAGVYRRFVLKDLYSQIVNYVLVLDNGLEFKLWEVFPSAKDAYAEMTKALRLDIDQKRMELDKLRHELECEEQALERIQKNSR